MFDEVSLDNFSNTGHNMMRKKILETLKEKHGYNYVQINEFDFINVGTIDKRLEYLKEKGLDLKK